MNKNISLPTMHDGVAHASFFMSMFHSDQILLNKVPMSLSSIFSLNYQEYYPTGTHGYLAIFNGYLIKCGLIDAAQFLKSWLILTNTLITLIVWWICRNVYSRCSEWFFLSISLLMTYFYHFPVWATDSGGFSRIVALTIVIPMIFGFLNNQMFFKNKYFQVLNIALLFVGVFHMHPTSFLFFVMSLFSIFVFNVWQSCLKKSNYIELILQYLCIFLFGIIPIVFLFVSLPNGAYVEQTKEIAQGNILWPKVTDWWLSTLNVSWKEYHSPIYLLTLRQFVVILGLFATVLGFFRKSNNLKYFYYITSMIFATYIVSICINSNSQVLAKVGKFFLYKSGRFGESFFLPHLLLVVIGAASAIAIIKSLINDKKYSKIYKLTCFVLFISVCSELQKNFSYTKIHLYKWFARYSTPTHERYSDVANYIKQHFEKDAILIFDQYIADILWPKTNRIGLFMYHECPRLNNNNCEQRKQFSSTLHRTLMTINSKQDKYCIQPIMPSFQNKTYIILDNNHFNDINKMDEGKLCNDLFIVYKNTNFTILKFNPT